MTGWVKTNDASQIFDASGKNQQEINNLTKEKTLSFIDFGAKGDGVTDDSVSIGLASTYSSMYKRGISGVGKTYACSNVFFDSYCYLSDAYLVNNANADLISVLTTTVSSDWLENVTFENIHIDGKRIDQTNVEGGGQSAEDGGRHGFRFRRPCRNITLRNSGADYCAGDGIILFPSGAIVKGEFLVQNFVIDNCHFNWNRRHGGSSDRVNRLTLINTQCKNNGRYLPGHENDSAGSGAQGDRVSNNTVYYGNGWDCEEYGNDAISINMSFINCDMTDNAKGGLLILPTGAATLPNFDTNIKVIGGSYNRGVLNSSDSNAITITPNGVTNVLDIFRNTLVDGVTIPSSDAILLRNNKNYIVTNTSCILTAVEYSVGYYDQAIKTVNSAASSKNYSSLVVPQGKIYFQKEFDLLRFQDTPVVRYTATSYSTAKREDYYYNSTVHGRQTASLNSNGTLTWSVQTNGSSTVPQIEATASGVKINVTPSHTPTNNGDMTFETLGNYKLNIKLKGPDSTVRVSSISFMSATATYDPPSLAAGARSSIQTITVTGAALGDIVAMSFSNDLQGVSLLGYVSAANTVSYYFDNGTASIVDLGSGIVKAKII